jgi:hypothetical protein
LGWARVGVSLRGYGGNAVAISPLQSTTKKVAKDSFKKLSFASKKKKKSAMNGGYSRV